MVKPLKSLRYGVCANFLVFDFIPFIHSDISLLSLHSTTYPLLQFLYEAGFSSSLVGERKGVIGVTQPRRVAVLATARRVAFELGLSLGKEVGFQVRHDKMIGANCAIKFMTDGILLREIQVIFSFKLVLLIPKPFGTLYHRSCRVSCNLILEMFLCRVIFC